MKMYILVRRKAPKGFGVNAVGHAALMCYLKYEKDPIMQNWVQNHFNKVTCLVNDEEYKFAKKAGKFVEFREDDLDNMPLALAFCPREKWPIYFKSFQLYS